MIDCAINKKVPFKPFIFQLMISTSIRITEKVSLSRKGALRQNDTIFVLMKK